MGLRPDEVDLELSALRADVEALSLELLSRYEEITLLYDLARDMGAVTDIAQAAGSVLGRSLAVVPALLALVLVGESRGELEVVAERGEAASTEPLLQVARRAVSVAIRTRARVLVHAGETLEPGTEPFVQPVLVAPLWSGETTDDGVAMVGAVVFVGHRHADRYSAGEASLGEVVARQLSLGLETVRLVEERREREHLDRELRLAADIQRSLLPPSTPAVPGAVFAARCLPAAQVGGDYYDFVVDADGVVSFVVADVSGHGLGPGMIMAMTRSVLRAELRTHSSLAEALAQTNTVMWDDLVATEAFITLFAAQYDPRSRRLVYVNGGHHPALLRRADGRLESLTSFGMPFGFIPDPSYEEQSVTLQPGDRLLVFSDGVVEATDAQEEPFGTPRLGALVQDSGPDSNQGSAEMLLVKVLDELDGFHGPAGQEDDVTVVALQVLASVLAPAGRP